MRPDLYLMAQQFKKTAQKGSKVQSPSDAFFVWLSIIDDIQYKYDQNDKNATCAYTIIRRKISEKFTVALFTIVILQKN